MNIAVALVNYNNNYSVSQKNPLPWHFLTFFPKRLGIFSPNFTHLLYIPIYAGIQVFIQLPATLTKLCHIKFVDDTTLSELLDNGDHASNMTQYVESLSTWAQANKMHLIWHNFVTSQLEIIE